MQKRMRYPTLVSILFLIFVCKAVLCHERIQILDRAVVPGTFCRKADEMVLHGSGDICGAVAGIAAAKVLVQLLDDAQVTARILSSAPVTGIW